MIASSNFVCFKFTEGLSDVLKPVAELALLSYLTYCFGIYGGFVGICDGVSYSDSREMRN